MNNFTGVYQRLVSDGPRSTLEKLLFAPLVSASHLFALIACCRRFAYRCGFFNTYRAAVPVVSVGNLTVGGTGKTPVVDWLVRWAVDRDIRVAVVSRGYGGRRVRDPMVVSDGCSLLNRDPIACGDEPLLLATRNPRAMVIVARKRWQGVALAERLDAALIILDDGFQHLAVARDLNIALLDHKRPFGNRHLLPAGTLREPPGSLDRADLVILTRSEESSLPTIDFTGPVLTSRHLLAEQLVSLHGEPCTRDVLMPLRCIAFAGIADPAGFFKTLRGQGYQIVKEVAFADHQVYSEAILAELAAVSKTGEVCLTTEKDAVKLRASDLPIPCYQVPLELTVEPAQILEEHLAHLMKRSHRNMIAKELLEILACPQCKGKVTPDEEQQRLVCENCRLAYPVRDEIPVMLVDEAVKLS